MFFFCCFFVVFLLFFCCFFVVFLLLFFLGVLAYQSITQTSLKCFIILVVNKIRETHKDNKLLFIVGSFLEKYQHFKNMSTLETSLLQETLQGYVNHVTKVSMEKINSYALMNLISLKKLLICATIREELH